MLFKYNTSRHADRKVELEMENLKTVKKLIKRCTPSEAAGEGPGLGNIQNFVDGQERKWSTEIARVN